MRTAADFEAVLLDPAFVWHYQSVKQPSFKITSLHSRSMAVIPVWLCMGAVLCWDKTDHVSQVSRSQERTTAASSLSSHCQASILKRAENYLSDKIHLPLCIWGNKYIKNQKKH